MARRLTAAQSQVGPSVRMGLCTVHSSRTLCTGSRTTVDVAVGRYLKDSDCTCCGQCVDVGNRFLAMPSNRNRILGVQMWKYHITGFLHWGYNFWNSQLSKAVIDPFKVTDAGGAFPGGDGFSVYPGENGPLPSLRQKVFAMALYDMRALSLAEEKLGRESVLKLLGDGESMTFANYPRTSSYLPDLRERVNEAIGNACK